jgi:hypothetical protein
LDCPLARKQALLGENFRQKIMMIPTTSLLEVHGDRVVAVQGPGEDTTRAEFAREAEGLHSRACQIGESLGLFTLVCCVASDERGGLAFRFPGSSAEKFDARGLIVKGGVFHASSLLEATK